jgi:hypothetical protein
MEFGREIEIRNVLDFFASVTFFIDRYDLLKHCGYSLNSDDKDDVIKVPDCAQLGGRG